MIEFIINFDLTKLIELSVSSNNIGNSGFKMLVEQAYMPNLKRLHSMNNQITELPDMEALIKL